MALLLLLLAGTAFAQFPAYQDVTDFNLPNNSLYLRWRPQYHVLPPGGHMNDPCGPMYDPTARLYHIFYQSFPQHVGFGNTSWSHATSPDLVSWTDVNGWQNRSMVAISTGPYPQYDWIGSFSGGAQPVNLHGEVDGNLTLFYTGASRFPDNWRVPYAPMTEQQAIATSSDGGKTWQKYGVVIDQAPGGWNVTGFRDPIFAKMPEMDRILGRNESWYMVFGSGIRGIGPRIPLYAAPGDDLTQWTFLGGLFEIGGNVSWGGDVRTGNFGFNFELAGLFTLPEPEGEEHWILTMGAEGYATDQHPVAHWSLFAMGSMTRRDNGSAEMEITASGVLDWAESYALNQFYDPVHKRRVLWGWTDEALNSTLPALRAQGFAGSLGLPRELYLLVAHGVAAPAGGIGKSAETWTADGQGTYTVKTLAQRPLPDVVAGVQEGEGTDLGTITITDTTMLDANSSAFHLQVTGDISDRFSILVRATPDLQEFTNITYLPSNHSVIFDRSKSTLLPGLVTTTWVGSFYPFTYPNGSTELITMDVFVDGSLIEIFINDRFALTSRAYPSRHDALDVGLDASSNTTVKAHIWQKMRNVWPNRPVNASSPLVFDPFYETHLTFPNPYVAVNYSLYDGWKK